MQMQILESLNAARAAAKPVALLTRLDSGEQQLYFDDDENANDSLSDEHLTLAREALRHDQSKLVEEEQGSLFIQPFNTPLRMIVVGAVHIAQDLVTMASQSGFEVSLVDPRQAFASEARFPGIRLINEWPDKVLESLRIDQRSAIITLSHDPKLDDPALEIALKSNAFYIGSLGSRRTHAARLQRLGEKGFSEEQQARIQGPIGLDIGARSTAEIAISIMAQVIQMYRQSSE